MKTDDCLFKGFGVAYRTGVNNLYGLFGFVGSCKRMSVVKRLGQRDGFDFCS